MDDAQTSESFHFFLKQAHLAAMTSRFASNANKFSFMKNKKINQSNLELY
jgi:hypothetical protein